MKLNNKGFAITSILYTVFILFLMILLSVLKGLNIKREMSEKNIDDLKESLEETCYENTGSSTVSGSDQVLWQGKYVIKIGTTEYTTYLSKGKKLSEGTYVPVINIEDADTNVTIVEVCTTDEVADDSDFKKVNS